MPQRPTLTDEHRQNLKAVRETVLSEVPPTRAETAERLGISMKAYAKWEAVQRGGDRRLGVKDIGLSRVVHLSEAWGPYLDSRRESLWGLLERRALADPALMDVLLIVGQILGGPLIEPD